MEGEVGTRAESTADQRLSFLAIHGWECYLSLPAERGGFPFDGRLVVFLYLSHVSSIKNN